MNSAVSPKMLMGIGAAVVVVAGLLFYIFKASDPAASGPIPYKKFDYGAHMVQQKQEYNRQAPSTYSTSAPGTSAPGTSAPGHP